MFEFIKQVFITLLSFSISLQQLAWLFLNNQLCMTRPTIINIEHVNLCVFNMITRTNQLKTLVKHISCECKCKFDGRKCNSNKKWNNDKC